MTRIALVVSDVDGTLLTKDKMLTDGRQGGGCDGCMRLVSASPSSAAARTIGMDFSDRAAGDQNCRSAAFNGSFDRRSPDEPGRTASDPGPPRSSAASKSSTSSASISGCFTNDQWLTRKWRRRVCSRMKKHTIKP